MIGMDAATGKPLEGDAHLAQSIGNILTTPIGSCVMRRDYGSALFELIDAPTNAIGRLRLIAATADAVRRWEPRIRLTRIAVAPAEPSDGRFVLDLQGERTDAIGGRNALTRLTIPLPN